MREDDKRQLDYIQSTESFTVHDYCKQKQKCASFSIVARATIVACVSSPQPLEDANHQAARHHTSRSVDNLNYTARKRDLCYEERYNTNDSQ